MGKPGIRATAKAEGPSFFAFIKEKEQRAEVLVGALAACLLYGLYAWCYPMAYTTADTPNYVLCARIGDFNGYRPVGFSWLLRFVHLFNRGFNAVSLLHFLLVASSLLFLAFTVKRFFPPRRPWLFRILLALLLLTPGPLFMTRWNLSDPSALAFTWYWCGSLLWLLDRPSRVGMLLLHAFVLFMAMKVRYASMVLPVISIIALWLRHGLKRGWYAQVLSAMVALIVFAQGRMDNERLLHIPIFSGFSGWAQANNASAIIPYIRGEKEHFSSPELQQVHERLLAFNDSCYTFNNVCATNFIWGPKFPGKAFLGDVRKAHPRLGYVWSWVHCGDRFQDYASTLRWRHPWLYLRHFIAPNAANLFTPPQDILPFPPSKVDPESAAWFGITERTYTCRYDAYHALFRRADVIWYQSLLAAVLIAGIWWWYNGSSKRTAGPQRSMVIAMGLFIGLSFLFLVIGHPVLFRYVVGFTPVFLLMLYMLTSTWVPRPAKAST